ncbi:hypothetical protein DYB32_000636 [Aphanomyces invadans]|uniref:Uncharacterized protein n=1 Tax=Aphanomyces invadans TaxID=157072 RepID=A0A3R6ZX03_9STRA|nr:hypothetical protein DYB32_000636 [Aphanomyces invadans]
MVLAHIAEVAVAGTMSQKTKHISALTASTDVVGTLFFAHEGSQSIRVVPVDALVQGRSTSMRKVLRKAATRNSAITALTYHTSHAVLGCGASDGSVQLWKLADTSELAAGRADAAAGEAELTHDVVAALNAKPAAVQSLVVHVTDSGALHVAITYVSRHIDVYRVQDRQLSPSTPIGSVGLPHGFTFAKKQAIAFGHVPNTLLVVLDDAATVGGAVLHLVRYGGPDDATRFGTPLDLYALGPNDTSAFVHVAVCGSHGSALYTSTATGRSVACLGYADDEPIDSPTCRQWSTSMPLSFGQYCHPESIPDSFLQLAWVSPLVARMQRLSRFVVVVVVRLESNQLAMPLRLVASPDLARAGVLVETSSSVAVFVTSAESSATYDVADACFTLQGHLVTLVPSRKSVPQIAVLTTHRVVILNPSLVAVASYAPTNPLVMTPVSMLWIGSAIAFVTGGGGALYYLPTQKQPTTVPALLCTLAKPAPSVAFSAIQLIACLPDRLVYTVQLPTSGTVATFGQFSVAGQCYDVAGNDRALVELVSVLKCGEREALDALVNAIRPTNGPLAAALTGGTRPEIMPKHDPFRLLCNEHVTFERRSRLLPSVTSVLRQAKLQSPPAPTMPPLQWKYYSWRRLAPEEMGEWTGSTHVHYATEEFKPRKHAAATSAVAGKLSVDTQQSSFHDADNGGAAGPLSTAAAAIGPFLEEEDGVVAYWRFEEGAAHATVTSGTQFVDTSKRENHITLQNLDLVVSTAPVDRGEEAKLQPEYALRFPSPSAGGCGHVVVKKGASTLDIGVSYDDDPYRRSLTVEMWIKPVETAAGAFTGTLMRRETPSPGDALWELAVDSGALAFTLLGQTVRTDKSAVKEATWQHVAAVVDVSSDDKATIRLAVGGAVAVTNDVRLPKAAQSGDVSTLVVGPNLGGVEVTEIRIWATPRSAQQLHDMKENYLAMAESKKRIKMKIHNRDCQCDKCLGRRQHTPIAKLAMVQPLALTPTSRDRRQRMKTPKSEETRT